MTQPADIVFKGGPVFTSDAARSWGRAVAVRSGRIAAVGGDADIDRFIGPDTTIIDLDGRFMCAGFQDAHVHPISGGLTMLRCDLLDIRERDEGLRAIADYVRDHPGEPWIRGGGWKFHWFDGGTPPAALLDQLVPDRPAYLRVADGHAGWANSLALAAAGIDASHPDPADGRIERLADGTPQGTLQEGAMNLVERVLPADDAATLDRGLAAGQGYLTSLGITGWQDAWVTDELHAAYLRATKAGTLAATVRGALWWDREAGLEQLDAMEELRRQSSGRYRAGSVKLMLDGVCENFTARMLHPYLDGNGEPTSNTGIDFIDPGALPGIVTEVMRRGFQPHFHALGDAAVRGALDAVAAAREAVGWTDLRPHIAHIQVIDPDDLARFRTLGVTANAQALWACADEAMTDMTLPFLDRSRASLQYPFHDLLRHGATLALGSDWSVTSANVMQQVDVAVHRRVPGDPTTSSFLPEQRITVADAVAGFTAGSAYVNHLDATHGSVEVGKMADLVVLNGNPFSDSDISAIEVDLTLIEGEVVYERGTTDSTPAPVPSLS